jgi:hypothetical protein
LFQRSGQVLDACSGTGGLLGAAALRQERLAVGVEDDKKVE